MKYQTQCIINCSCHTREGLAINKKEHLPAIDCCERCCEHCCKLWKEHNKQSTVNISTATFKRVKKLIATDPRVTPLERKNFNEKGIMPLAWQEDVLKEIEKMETEHE